MADLFELGSFLLMLYGGLIALYVTRRAARLSLPLVVLPLLLAFMFLLHGIHHLFAYLGYSIFEEVSEFGAAVFALALALTYAYIWRKS